MTEKAEVLGVRPERVGIIGSGMIGRAWAIVFAKAGCSVSLYCTRLDRSGPALRAIADTLGDMDAAGLLDEGPQDILARIVPTDSLEQACAGSALVQENAPEQVEIKQSLFAELDRLCDDDAILASSTSWLPASQFTESLPGRRRCLVAHPTNPPNVVPLVELCPAPWTSAETVDRALAIYTAVGQEPVLVRNEISGFLLNRIQGAVLTEVLNLFEQGYASAADLDKVMKFGLGLRWSFMGPFETIDLNAPGGVRDYASRYGPSYVALADSLRRNDWSVETLARLEAERRQVLGQDGLAKRARWRDARLMALRKHQGEQADE